MGFCLASLWSLGIPQEKPVYGVFAVVLAAGTLLLTMTDTRNDKRFC